MENTSRILKQNYFNYFDLIDFQHDRNTQDLLLIMTSALTLLLVKNSIYFLSTIAWTHYN